jgi:hypothetical protein
MNVLEDIICMQCNQKIVNYSNQLCRKQFLSSSRTNEYNETRNVQINEVNIIENELINGKTSGNFILDEFIKETQLNSKYCDDFIEWIPRSNLENVKYLTNGGNSKIYFGTWNLLLNMSLASIASKQLSFKIALKVIDGSDNINDHILNEVRKNKIKKGKIYIFSKFNCVLFSLKFTISAVIQELYHFMA